MRKRDSGCSEISAPSRKRIWARPWLPVTTIWPGCSQSPVRAGRPDGVVCPFVAGDVASLPASTMRTSPLAMIRRPAMVAGTAAAGVGAGSPLDCARAGVWPGGMASTSRGRPRCSSQWPRNGPGRWLSVVQAREACASGARCVRRSGRTGRRSRACSSVGASSWAAGVRKPPAAARGVLRVLASGNDRGWFGSSAKTGVATRHQGRSGHCGCGGGGRAGACGPAIDASCPLIGGGRWMRRRPGMNGGCWRGRWRPVWGRGNGGVKG